jgi:hypothetical protein
LNENDWEKIMIEGYVVYTLREKERERGIKERQDR